MFRYILIFSTTIFISSCVSLPHQYQTKNEIITTGAGPEDMVIDTISEQPRILISCNSRRANEPYYGEINIYYPANGQVKILPRHEPPSVHFYPHGIDLVRVKDSLILLVVNNDSKHKEQSILRYRVLKDSLVFLNKITDPLITSPNAVTGFADGSMLISNDAKKVGNFIEAFFLLKRCQITFYKDGKCSVAAQKFCFTNGITNKNQKVYLVSTRQNKLWQFDFTNGKMLNKQVIANVHGPDNIRIDGDRLFVACHLRFLDFLKHMKDPAHHSPTTVYEINLNTHQKKVAYFDDGAQLSAGSTGLLYNKHLYVSGVFDGKIARVDY